MNTVALISCASKKRPHAAPAADLYDSTLFRLSLAYARTLKPDTIHILSTKHHLLDLDEVIQPYDLTLNNMPAADIRAWADPRQLHYAKKPRKNAPPPCVSDRLSLSSRDNSNSHACCRTAGARIVRV